jgi:hypothetical protein
VAFSAERRSVGSSPLTSPFVAACSGVREHPFCQRLVLFRVSDTSMSTDAPEPGDAFHRRSPRALSFEGPTWGVAPLASGVSPPHVIIDVDDIDQTPRPPVLTGWLGAACAPAASASSCLHEHDHGPLEHPDRRVCVRDDCQLRQRVSPEARAIAKRARGQGQGNTAPLRSPRRLLAPETSPQPWPASGASCRGFPPFALSGETRGEGETAIAWHGVSDVPQRACKATRRGGPCDTAPPRRGPMFTNPRHLPSRGRSKTNGGACSQQS